MLTLTLQTLAGTEKKAGIEIDAAALGILQDLQSRGFQMDAVLCSGLCRACESSRRWDVALSVLEEHSTLVLDALACTALMRLLGAGKKWRRCLEVFRDMCREGPVPDAKALCAVVACCANSSKWPQVLVLLEDAWSQIWKPNTVVYNSAISASAREEHWEVALALVEDLSGHLLRADAVTCSSVVSACEKGKQWQLALLLFCQSPNRNAMAASAALSAFAKAEENAVSVALLRSLAGLQVEPSAAAFNAASSTRYWKESLFFLLWGEVLGVAATAASAGAKVKAFECGSQWQSILSLGRLGTGPGGGAAGMVSAVSACEEASEWARSTALLLQASLPPSVAAWNSAMASKGWRAALWSLERAGTQSALRRKALDMGFPCALLSAVRFWRSWGSLSPPSAIDWQGKRKTEWQRQYPVEQQGGCSGTPQHTLPGISIAADAECSRPKVHKSLTGGKYCSCDEGKAVNWKEALGEAQAQVEKVMKPKLDALHSAVSELEESLGIEIDEFLVRRFPRKAGQGLWPQASARKMLRWSPDSGAAAFTTRHRCELVRRRTGTSTATTTTRSTSSEPRTTPEEPTTTEPRTTPEEPTATKKQLPTHLLTAIRGFDKADLHTTQQPESESGVIPPAPPVPAATGEKTVRSNRDRSSWTTSRRNASG
eukprot:s2273_g7.t1